MYHARMCRVTVQSESVIRLVVCISLSIYIYICTWCSYILYIELYMGPVLATLPQDPGSLLSNSVVLEEEGRISPH